MTVRKKILIIDDDDDFLESIQAMLLHRGYDAIPASGGSEGIAEYKKHKPDMVFLDIRMPKIDGYKTAKSLKEFDPNARMVLISSYDLDDEKFDTVGGFSHLDIVDKPVNLVMLEKMIKKHAK